MEFKTTKEFIVQAHSAACTDWKKRIEKEFPEAFKTQLEVGKWYYNEEYDIVLYLTGYKYDDAFNGYGFNKDKEWFSCDKSVNIFAQYCNREATNEEVESALIAEAKKRGFLEGSKFKSSLSENGRIRTVRENGSFYFYIDNNVLTISTPQHEWDNSQSNPTIFTDGIWAEPLHEEKTTISKEKALKIIAKKLKVSPGNIVIE